MLLGGAYMGAFARVLVGFLIDYVAADWVVIAVATGNYTRFDCGVPKRPTKRPSRPRAVNPII